MNVIETALFTEITVEQSATVSGGVDIKGIGFELSIYSSPKTSTPASTPAPNPAPNPAIAIDPPPTPAPTPAISVFPILAVGVLAQNIAR